MILNLQLESNIMQNSQMIQARPVNFDSEPNISSFSKASSSEEEQQKRFKILNSLERKGLQQKIQELACKSSLSDIDQRNILALKLSEVESCYQSLKDKQKQESEKIQEVQQANASLQQANNKLQEANQDLLNRKRKVEAECSELRNEDLLKRRRLNFAETQHQKLTRNLETAELENKKLSRDVGQQVLEIDQLVNNNQLLTQDKEQLLSYMADLEIEKTRMAADWQRTIDSLEEQQREQISANESLKTDFCDLESEYENRKLLWEEVIKEQEERVKSLEEQLASQQSQEWKKKYSDLSENYRVLREEFNLEQEAHGQLQDDYKKFKSESKKKHNQHNKLIASLNKKSEEEARTHQVANKKLQEEIDALRLSLLEKDEQLVEKSIEIFTLTNDKSVLQNENNQLNEKVMQLTVSAQRGNQIISILKKVIKDIDNPSDSSTQG